MKIGGIRFDGGSLIRLQISADRGSGDDEEREEVAIRPGSNELSTDMAALTPLRQLLRENVVLQCGVPDCVCERERLDVHTQEPMLPDGCVRGHASF